MAKKSSPTDRKIAEMTEDLKRIQAEFINFKRRSEEERSQLADLVKQDLILEVLPLLDNIERALAHRPDDLKDHAWAEGVSRIGSQVTSTLKGLGVERIKAEGQPFDPNQHEAIGFESGEGDHEVVVEEVQPGYRLGDRVLRPAVVRVGASKLNPTEGEQNG